MNNRVIIRKVDKKLFDYHYSYTKDSMLSTILSNRGVVKKLPTKDDPLSSPFVFKEMEKLVKFLEKEIENNPEDIIVHNDYDNDGFSGAFIFLSFVKEKYGVDLDFYMNSREEGYEMTKDIIDKFLSMNKKIIITIDKGISSYEGISYAKSKGMTVIVTDHHQPKLDENGNKKRSQADFIICNTLEKGEGSIEICGAATIWYVCRALDEDIAEKYVDVAGIATIVDMVPMNDIENRKIVLKSLDRLRSRQFSSESYKRFFNSVLNGKKFNEISILDFGFNLGPVINAACRYNFGPILLKEMVDYISLPTIEKIIQMNERRKREVDEIIQLLRDNRIESQNYVVLKHDEIPHQLVGLVASRFSSELNKTTFVMHESKDSIKCSARSNTYNLQELFTDKYQVEIKGGGHNAAVGFELKPVHFEQFIEELNRNVVYEPIFYVDGFVSNFNNISIEVIEKFNNLEPYGQQFSEPTFLIDISKYNIDYKKIIKENHLSFKSGGINFINFNTNFEYVDINNLDKYYFIGSFNINNWNGRKNVQCIINNILKKEDTEVKRG